MIEHTKRPLLVTGLLAILFTSMLTTAPSEASVVWSDDFDDGNLDGWTQSGCAELSLYHMKFIDGNATAADKNLQATGEWVAWAYTYITHPTMTTTGTWSFDVYLPEEGIVIFSCIVDFMDKPTLADETWFYWNGYEIWFNEEGNVQMSRTTAPRDAIHPQDEQFSDEHQVDLHQHQVGWKHIDITRENSGRWRTYLNGTLILEVTDNTFPTFEYFGFWLSPGPIYDNVVVRDTVYVPPGSLKITVKDSGGNALAGATVSSSKQPSGQTALGGTTTANGTVTFAGLAMGNYTLQVSKDSYVSGSAQGAVASGAKTELSVALQAQPSSGIPGYPIASMVVGLLLCSAWLWMHTRRSRMRGV